MLSNVQFTIPEILSLLGLAQCLYVLVYMLFRSGHMVNAIIPLLYFTFMGMAFFLDAADSRWSPEFDRYEQYQWLFWFAGIPAGALLIFQIANIAERPKPKYFFLLLLIPITFLPGYAMNDINMLYVSGLVIGALSLLAVWLRRDLLDGLHGQAKFGEERFWLILALITLMTAFLGFSLAFMSEGLGRGEWGLVRTILGIAFVYIAATSLFRIYPQAFRLQTTATRTDGDGLLLDRLRGLLEREKVYQEPSYGRAELARELGLGEAALSRLVNQRYGKTIPQLLNEYRVQDAQKLLTETDVPVQNVFEESGFNSITTFNRVFKDLTGVSPTEFRTRGKV